MVAPSGVEPLSPGSKPGVLTVRLRGNLGWLEGIEPSFTGSQPAALPLRHSQHMVTLAGFEPALPT